MSERRFNLEDYEPVEARVAKFWADHPEGAITTSLLPDHPDGSWIVRAEVFRLASDDRPAATGMAQEVIGSTPVNKTSALENCETSAVGRALANMGYATKGQRPSREEMAKVARHEAASQAPSSPSAAESQANGADKHSSAVQQETIRKLAAKVGVDPASLLEPGEWIESLTWARAGEVIEALDQLRTDNKAKA